MKILIDLTEHEVDTVQEMGWAGFKNGDLIALAEADYKVFVTADKNLRYQQNMQSRRLSLIIFPTNKLSVIKQLETQLTNALSGLKEGDFIELAMPDERQKNS